MPSLSERPAEEREQLILHFFCQQAERVGRDIYISNRVFELLLQYEFPANIEQLKNCIQTSCANALVQSNDPVSYTHLECFPIYPLPTKEKYVEKFLSVD